MRVTTQFPDSIAISEPVDKQRRSGTSYEEDRPRVLACDDHVDWDGGSPQHGHEDRVHLDFPPRVHHLLFTFDLLPFFRFARWRLSHSSRALLPCGMDDWICDGVRIRGSPLEERGGPAEDLSEGAARQVSPVGLVPRHLPPLPAR